MNPENFQRVVDHAANQGVNWWLSALVVVAGLILLYFGRWLVTRVENLMADLKKSHADQTAILVGVVQENSSAFNRQELAFSRQASELHEVKQIVNARMSIAAASARRDGGSNG